MESTNVKNLKHLYDVTHSVPLVPEVGALYTQKLMKTVGHQGLTLPPIIAEGQFCEHCGCVLIAGVNMSMRIVYSKRGKKSDKKSDKGEFTPRERKLRISCYTCNKTMIMTLLQPVEKEKQKQEKDADKRPFVAEWNPKTSGAKERAKRRKQNNLSSLLKNKKQEEQAKKGSLLSLGDFMKM